MGSLLRLLRVAVRRPAALVLRAVRRWPWLVTLVLLRARFRDDRLGMTAGSLTFTTLISLVPLVTVMLALFSAFPVFGNFEGALEHYFLQSLVPDTIARPVLGALTDFSRNASKLGAVGLVALVGTALTLMLTIDRTLNSIWRVQSPRPIAQRVLVYWAAATLGPLVLGISLTLTSYAVSASKGLVDDVPGVWAWLLRAAEFAAIAIGMATLYRTVPNTHVRWRHALSGAVFVAVAFELAKNILAWYVQRIPTYAMVYGAFSAVPIFLVWMYTSWVIVLLGAVIAAYGPTLQLRVVYRTDVPGGRFRLAVAIVRLLADARDDSHAGWRADDLAQALHSDPLQIQALLDLLQRLDWCGRLAEAGDARHVLLCRPDATPARPLVAALLLEAEDPPTAFWQRAGFDRLSLRDLISDEAAKAALPASPPAPPHDGVEGQERTAAPEPAPMSSVAAVVHERVAQVAAPMSTLV